MRKLKLWLLLWIVALWIVAAFDAGWLWTYRHAIRDTWMEVAKLL